MHTSASKNGYKETGVCNRSVWRTAYLHIVSAFGLGVHHQEAVIQVLLGSPSGRVTQTRLKKSVCKPKIKDRCIQLTDSLAQLTNVHLSWVYFVFRVHNNLFLYTLSTEQYKLNTLLFTTNSLFFLKHYIRFVQTYTCIKR